MGLSVGKQETNSKSNLHIVMLGLDSSGKTTALYRLKFDQYLNTVPTIGFNCEKVVKKSKGISFLIWDIGGHDKLRPLWRSYTRCTDGIVFVVDSVDDSRLEEAKVELLRTAKQNECVPLLVMANKQDLPGAKQPKEVATILGLNQQLLGHNSWHVCATCAINGEGLDEALQILYQMIAKNRRQIKTTKKHKNRSKIVQ